MRPFLTAIAPKATPTAIGPKNMASTAVCSSVNRRIMVGKETLIVIAGQCLRENGEKLRSEAAFILSEASTVPNQESPYLHIRAKC